MSQRRLLVATANAGKVELLRELFGASWELVPVNPGDAESKAEVAYASAALAKASAVAGRGGGEWAIGWDSGFEFACLKGEPGPLTARKLEAQGVGNFVRSLVPGSSVRVVHCLAAVSSTGAYVVEMADQRSVADMLPLNGSGDLPLGAIVRGPRRALRHCVVHMQRAIMRHPGAARP